MIEVYFIYVLVAKRRIRSQNAKLSESSSIESDLSANSNIDMILKSEKTQEKVENRRNRTMSIEYENANIFTRMELVTQN